MLYSRQEHFLTSAHYWQAPEMGQERKIEQRN